jgi:hypothetical protein
VTDPSFVAGNTGSKLHITCKDNDSGSVIDLTGSTVTLKWRSSLGAVTSKNMVITSPKTGEAEYQFADSELVAGIMDFDVEIQDSTGNIISSLEALHEWVRRKVG